MNRIMVSAYDRPYAEYGLRMYRSYARFNPTVRRFFVWFPNRRRDAPQQREQPLPKSELAAIRDLGVEVLTIEQDWKVTGHFFDMLLWPAVKGLDWDALMWVDADALVLRPLDPAWWPRVDFVSPPDRDDNGLFTECDIVDGRWYRRPGPCAMFASGIWVCRSRPLLKHFFEHVDAGGLQQTGSDQIEITRLVNTGPYTYEQLNGYLWNFSRQMIPAARYARGQTTYREHGRTWRPYIASFSRVPVDGRDVRLTSPALEQFYKEQVCTD